MKLEITLKVLPLMLAFAFLFAACLMIETSKNAAWGLFAAHLVTHWYATVSIKLWDR